MLAACDGLNMQVVLAGWDASTAPAPANAIVVGRAPQKALLARAAVFVSHAGFNSALEGLAAEAPMAAVPLANDQFGVTARLAWHGAGTVVAQRAASPPRLRAAIVHAQGDGAMRAAVRPLGAAVRAAPGAVGAAAAITRALERPSSAPMT